MKIIFIHIAKNCGNSVKRFLVLSKKHELCDLGRLFHVQVSLKDYEKKRKDISEYFKFTIIRNPWDRIVSYYNYILKCPLKHIEFIEQLENKYKTNIKNIKREIIGENLKEFKYLKYSNEYINALKKRNMFNRRIDEILQGKEYYKNIYNNYKKYSFKDFWINVIKGEKYNIPFKRNIHFSFLRTQQKDKIKVENYDNSIDMILRYENLNNDIEILKKKLNLNYEFIKVNNNNHDNYKNYYDDQLKKMLLPFIKDDLEYFSYKF